MVFFYDDEAKKKPFMYDGILVKEKCLYFSLSDRCLLSLEQEL